MKYNCIFSLFNFFVNFLEVRTAVLQLIARTVILDVKTVVDVYRDISFVITRFNVMMEVTKRSAHVTKELANYEYAMDIRIVLATKMKLVVLVRFFNFLCNASVDEINLSRKLIMFNQHTHVYGYIE